MLVTSRDEKYVDQIQKLIGKKIPSRTLEGLAEATQARPPRDDRRGDRGRPRQRGGNDRDKRSHPIKPHGQVASMQPAPAAAEVIPVAAAPQPAPRNDHRQDHRQKHQQPQKNHAPKPQQQHRQQNDDVQDTRSQLPAFLLRPVKLPPVVEKPARAKKKEDAADA
jgi:hypothetical protein